MKVAVLGGTGFIGSKLVEKLKENGHEAEAHSRSTGLNLLTGAGLGEALRGTQAAVVSINAPQLDASAVDFFRTTMRNTVDAAQRAGVGHVVLLSIVGIDQVPDVGYYRAKVEEENVLKASRVPFTIVRATQFMEFIPGIMEWTTQGDTVRLPATPMQPIAAAEVVDFLARVTVGEPRGGTVNVAGPEVFTLDELARLILNHRRDGRTVVTDHIAGLFAAVPGRAIVAPKHAHLSSVRYADWMATSPSEPR